MPSHPLIPSHPRFLRLLALLLCLACALAARASEFPGRPLSMVIAWPAGSASDIAARMIGRYAEKNLGQPIVFINRVGGDGSVAWSETLRAKPDGYTLTVVNYDVLTNQSKGSDIRYDSFAYMMMFTVQPLCLYVRKESPYATLQDLVRAAKERPGQVNIATTGFGGFLHQALHLLERKYEVRFNAIPYKGTSEIMNAELGGQLDASLNVITLPQQHIAAGTVRALLCFTQERLPDYAGVPTVTELGISETDFSSWRAVAVSRDVPADVQARLRDAFVKAYHDPAYQQAARQANLDLKFMDNTQIMAFLAKQYPVVRDTVKALGFAK